MTVRRDTAMRGYGGKILFVDLDAGRAWSEPLAEETARAFLGGNGLAAHLLYRHLPAGVDPY
ncbi:MAG: hypothetical protein HY724_11310, partial [Candidatus Rokubacteria bacterium]|nr:hypothetical protein [Candidatus Rokubacteria bacterium]